MRFGLQLCTLGDFADPEIVSRLLAGERVNHRGEHYVVDDVTLAPLPLRPIPIWIGGMSPKALRRAARWDGWLADSSDRERNLLAPDDVRARTDGLELTDVCFIGYAAQADVDAYDAAGVTWWVENVRGSPDKVRRRILSGPPR